jgi:hypothetical protein
MVMSYRLDARGSIPSRIMILHFSVVSRVALGHTCFPVQWVLGHPSLGIKQQRHAADHSPLSSAKVINGAAIPPFPHVFVTWYLIN